MGGLQGCFTCGQIEFLVFEIGLKKEQMHPVCASWYVTARGFG